jgi:hypothetical protein
LPRAVRLSILLVSYTLSASLAHAQAGGAAAVDGLLSTFAALTGTQTGLGSGRNLGITAGVDLGFQPFHGLYPSLEARGTYPIDKGNVDSQKTLLGGLKLAVPLPFIPRIRPYGTALFGRGSINYGAGYEVPGTPIFYTISHSNVFDLGGGVDLKLSPHLDPNSTPKPSASPPPSPRRTTSTPPPPTLASSTTCSSNTPRTKSSTRATKRGASPKASPESSLRLRYFLFPISCFLFPVSCFLFPVFTTPTPSQRPSPTPSD